MKRLHFGLIPFGCFCMAPDDGGAGGGSEGEKDPKDIELENLKQQLEAEKQKAAEAEKRLKDAEDAKLSEDERNAAAAKEEKTKTVATIKELQAKALGIDAKYIRLIQGETADEIRESAELLAKIHPVLGLNLLHHLHDFIRQGTMVIRILALNGYKNMVYGYKIWYDGCTLTSAVGKQKNRCNCL